MVQAIQVLRFHLLELEKVSSGFPYRTVHLKNVQKKYPHTPLVLSIYYNRIWIIDTPKESISAFKKFKYGSYFFKLLYL